MVSVPVWMLVAAGVGYAFLGLILFLVWTNRFPPADRGGAIINFDSLKAMNQAVEAVCYATGKKPRFIIEGEIDGERLPRYMWPGGEIWHVQGPKVRDLVEGKQVAFAIVVKNPDKTVRDLSRLTVGARPIRNPDSKVPQGAMHFVLWSWCPFVLVVRKDFSKMGKMPPKWQRITS